MSRPTVGISAYDIAATELVELARAADESGFGSLWLGEHLFLPVEYSTPHPTKKEPGVQHHTGPIIDPDTKLLEPIVALAAVAAATTRLRLATGMYILPLRHPLATARAVCTLQELAGGRFAFGLGVGWLREEFDAMNVPFPERVTRFEETIAILRAAWSGRPFSHDGKHFSFASVQVTPATTIPLVLGGNSEAALQRAARLGDGWFSSGTPSFDDARRLRDRVHAIRESEGLAAPFDCYYRVEGRDPSVIDRYRAEGLENVVIWADQVWRGSSLDEKRSSLFAAAEEFRLAAQPSAVAT